MSPSWLPSSLPADMEGGQSQCAAMEERSATQEAPPDPKAVLPPLSNPKAPAHAKVPSFSIPQSRRPRGVQDNTELRKLMMTPRVVTASARAFSSVVMTPRAADGAARPGAGAIPTPRAGSKVRVVRGAKSSARDEPIFKGGEGYVDRAVERREAVRRETRRGQTGASGGRGDEEGWETPPRGRGHGSEAQEGTSEEAVPLDLQEVQRQKREICEAEETRGGPAEDAHGPVSYRSPLAGRICELMGWGLLKGRPSAGGTDAFLPGRMAFVYDFVGSRSRTLPRTVLRSQAAVPAARGSSAGDFAVEGEIVEMIRARRAAPRAAPAAPEAAAAVRVDAGDDIFPDAGEYVFEPGLPKDTATTARTLFGAPIAAHTASELPRSIANLVGQMHPAGFSHAAKDTDDYAECYPGILEAPGIGFESEGEEDGGGERRGRRPEEGGGGQETRRKQATKSKQKLERQVTKVAKIMQEKYRDGNKEG